MDTLQAPRGSATGPAPPASPRPRLWPTLLIGLVIPALIASILVYMANYEPLAVGASMSSGAHTAKNLADLDNSVRPYAYAQDQMTYVSVFIVNDGQWGVTVSEVERTPSDFTTMMSLVDVRIPTDSKSVDPTASPFHPFSLGSGGDDSSSWGFDSTTAISSSPGRPRRSRGSECTSGSSACRATCGSISRPGCG